MLTKESLATLLKRAFFGMIPVETITIPLNFYASVTGSSIYYFIKLGRTYFI